MKSKSRIIESQKVWVGRNLKAHPAPTFCHGHIAPPRAPSNLALSASRDAHPQLL